MLRKIRSGFGRIVQVVNWAGLLSCFTMVVVVAVDVVLRKLRIGSIPGSNELTMYLMVLVCLLGIPVLQLKEGHVWVDLFVRLFPRRLRYFWRFAVMVVETGVVAMLAIGGYNKIVMFAARSTTTDVLRLPKSLFAVAGLVAFAEFFVLFAIDTLLLLRDGIKGDGQPADESGRTDEQVKGI
jgi:TRAP-type C4-dicarboxylate transport system permease small subunit